MRDATAPFEVVVEERIATDTLWIAIRARGAEWSWLTPKEAAAIAVHWLQQYGDRLGTFPPDR